MTFSERYEGYKAMIEPALRAYFGEKRGFAYDGLLDSMNYSLTAGGKRIRPVLVLEFCRVCGGDTEKALPCACAAEMLHTYSLIHDDLPCMDDDGLRRGKPTNHVVYGECTATLAGDALQAEAFGTILRSELPAERKARCAEILSGAAGIDGICGGQYMDMEAESRPFSADELSDLQARKTGSLLAAACMIGAASAGASEEKIDAAAQYGAALGAAFQIRDDILDVCSTDAELGKPVGSDEREGKTTFMSVYGREKCEDMVAKITGHAKEIAESNFDESDFLIALADKLQTRQH